MDVEEISKEVRDREACHYPCELTKALENESDCRTVGDREPFSLISNSDLNVGYGGQSTAVQKVGRTECAGENASMAPETPQRASEVKVNPGVCVCTWAWA